ncbi:MAG: hypothetical protein M3198_03125 [Actinomycetota bacterium]|nr:hypothetical protein [Actinomycetota bacterium]
MAIKGKKKSQKRGSQARRRPAAPPRAAVAPRRKAAWYSSTMGKAALGILAVIAFGVIFVLVQNARDEAAQLEKRQEALDSYTDELRSILQSLRPPAGAMAATPPALEEEEAASQLEEDAAGWVEQIEKAQTAFARVAPSGALLEQEPSIQNINNLYAQSLSIYLSAARTYQLAATVDAKAQADALAAASTQRGQASSIWTEATALLDKRRESADIDPSGLTAPDAAAGAPPAGAPPTDLPTDIPTDIPTEDLQPTDGGGGNGGGNGNNGG